jgi:hypothetical protein
MTNLLEFLFCPIHGVFRPDNILMLTNLLAAAIVLIAAEIVEIIEECVI